MKYAYLGGYPGNMYPADGFSVTEPVEHVLGRSYHSLSMDDLIEICSNYLLNKVIDKYNGYNDIYAFVSRYTWGIYSCFL